jgi:hypothetical protein
MATGTTYDFNLSRDEIITQALRKVGGLPQGEVMTAEQLQDGIASLNGIVRREDIRNKQLWKIATDPTYITLVANQTRYTTSNGLPSGILDIVSVRYVNSSNQSTPLKVLTVEDYDNIQNKLEQGDPQAIYMDTRRDLTATPTLFVWPVLREVESQSVVTGTDAIVYKCIRSHTADTDNKPITGSQYLQYWEAGGSSPSVWASGTDYTAPQRIALRKRAPLADFDLATDNADFPAGFGLWLTYELAHVLAYDYGVPLDERDSIGRQAQREYDKVFPYLIPDTTNHHNRSLYF